MGNPMTQAAHLPFGKASATTPLLGFIAGQYADQIARFWPAPHVGFLTLPTARRHAAAILVHRRWNEDGCDMLDIVRAVERERDSVLARILMRGEAPGGLMKALGRMGEVLWDAGDYANVLALFADPDAAVVLRHMPVIAAERLGLIARLPNGLRKPGIIAHLPMDEHAVTDFANAFVIVQRIHGPAETQRLVQRWERAGDANKLFDMMAEALQPTVFGQFVAPPKLPEGFALVTTHKTLTEVALEFRNCLRDFASDLATGRMAVYVVRRGSSPPVALALRLDGAGWRLAEAKLRSNEDLGEPHLLQVVQLLEAAGVRTGESTWTLARRLHEHVCEGCGPAHVPQRPTWRDQLVLGSLWD